eukprot:317044-Heterocapsa_arctica.AAC.1
MTGQHWHSLAPQRMASRPEKMGRGPPPEPARPGRRRRAQGVDPERPGTGGMAQGATPCSAVPCAKAALTQGQL